MKRLSARAHGILDYATVLFLALSPTLFDMHYPATVFTYSLACIHLLLTLFTNFEMGVIRVVPLYIHGTIELVVSVLLLAVAYAFHMRGDDTSFYFYLVFAVVLFIVWRSTNYKPAYGPVLK